MLDLQILRRLEGYLLGLFSDLVRQSLLSIEGVAIKTGYLFPLLVPKVKYLCLIPEVSDAKLDRVM